MEEISGARIIPFPRSAPRPPTTQSPALDDTSQRLQRALAALERAVAAQRDAVGQWRGALGGLRGNVQSLRDSLVDYDAKLGALRTEVESIGKSARGLEVWADQALSTQKSRLE